MSAQASLLRICLRCHIRIFSSRRGSSVLPNGYLLRSSGSRHQRKPTIRTGINLPQYRTFSSKGPRSEERGESHTASGNQPMVSSQQSENGVKHEENQRNRHGPLRVDSIAHLDAESFLASTKSREKKSVELEVDDPLLSPNAEKADQQFFESYNLLLSDTNYDMQMELEGGEETKWMIDESKKTSEAFKRMPVSGNYKSNVYPSGPVEIPQELRGAALKLKFPPATHRVQDLNESLVGQDVVMHGFLTPPRVINKKLMFINLFDFHSGPGISLQVVSNLFLDPIPPDLEAAHEKLLSLSPFTPVVISGKIVKRESTRRHKDEIMDLKGNAPKSFIRREFTTRRPAGEVSENSSTYLELHLQNISALNSVSKNLIYTQDTVFPPEQRHLQLRTHAPLFSALRLRAKAASICRDQLENSGFLEVETPLLFKSTPEGAREFLVPTRSKENGGGMCYALPQSPQQYKQILMASGVARYFQLAKCFRDEDLRADRQPEFTQLDLEMSFATGDEVMNTIEELLKRLWKEILHIDVEGEFQRMTWWYAMKFYGSDKPDLRFRKTKINEISSIVPHLVRNKDDHVEAFSFVLDKRSSPDDIKKLLNDFRAEFQGEGEDRFLSYIVGDPSTIDNTLMKAKLGEAELAHINKEIWALPGSIVVIKARKGHWSGGNTQLGLLRTAIINKARNRNLIRTPERPEFVWIIDFPLFSPSSDSEPGQRGTAGLSSTHHPFTAPHPKDIWLLPSSPEKVRGEHYDIVVNGIELGGGSRRIHDAALQGYVLKKVLKVHPSRIHQFDHLLEVLNSGCPPHAGIALGFDRLVAVLQGTDSVRDVIAFPKSAKGIDLLVGSPSPISDEDLETYHLKRVLS